MIYELLHRKPTISFGLGATEITINSGETVPLWISTLYNSEYSASVSKPSEVTAIKVSSQQFELISTTLGTYQIQVVYAKQNLKSNVLTLHVV